MILYAFRLFYLLGFILMAFICLEITYKTRKNLYNLKNFFKASIGCLVLSLGSWMSLVFLFIWDHYLSNRVKIKKGE